MSEYLGQARLRKRRRALRSVTTYAAVGGFPGHRRAMTKSKKPDPRQAGTAAHNHDSLRVAT